MKSHLAPLLVLALIATVAWAQECCDIDPSTVSYSTRRQWCQTQQTTCGELCDQSASANECDSSTLDFNCSCSSGNTPNVTDYAKTIPSFECQTWVSQCVANNTNDLSAQRGCQAVQCGSKDAVSSNGASTTSSSASSSTSGATGLALGDPSTTASSASADATPAESSISSIIGSIASATRSSSSTSGSVSSTASSSATGAASSQQTNTLDNSGGGGDDKSNGLSTGARAGIAVGVVLGVIALLVTLFIVLRRRKGGKSGNSFWYHRSTVHGGMPELETKEKAGELWGSKFHHTTDTELQGNELYQAPDDPTTGAALEAHANGSTSPVKRGDVPTNFELPAEAAMAHDVAHQRRPAQPAKTPSPFAGAGPVPTHLVDYEQAADEEPRPTPLAPSNTVVEPPASNVPAAPAKPAEPGTSSELAQLKAELEKVRQERDRLQMMHSLSSREEELRKAIEVREMG